MKAWDPGSRSDRAAAENGNSFLLIGKSAAGADGVAWVTWAGLMDAGITTMWTWVLNHSVKTHKTEAVDFQDQLMDPQPATC